MIGLAIGTRPELIKLRPVARVLKRLGVPCKIIYTEQHKAIRKDVGDLATEVNGHRQCVWVKPLEGWEWKPTAIVVQGDTDSARQWALDAAFKRIPVIHVEAGLRTSSYVRDKTAPAEYPYARPYSLPVPLRRPFPEELNRQLISRVASLHLCPTYANEQNLHAENVGGLRLITGNPGITALAEVVASQKVGTEREEHVLVTCHRRENWPHMKQLAKELAIVAPQIDYSVYWIRHPNAKLYEGINFEGWTEGVHLLDPFDHAQMVDMLLAAKLVVTDSGGLIEEATWLGKRRVCLRTETERPEACATLTAIEGCHKVILAALDEPEPSPGSRYAFGDENSALNCAKAIADFYKEL